MLNKIKILINTIIGKIIRYRLDFKEPQNLDNKENEPQIIVSLTSYGRRVRKTLPYTVMSLLSQSLKPDKILVWLDRSWKNKLPSVLKKLETKGVEIKFYDDIKSYKKLIPTLIEYPESVVITVDDDIIYSKFLIEGLIEGYKKNGCIQCTVGLEPIRSSDGNFAPYRDWIEVEDVGIHEYMVPIGAGGVLYPPFSLDRDVLAVHDFTNLAPNADDMWFWVMAKRHGTRHSFCKIKGTNYSFDALYQFFHKGSALTHSNAGESKNDIQLKRILDHYPIKNINIIIK